MGGSGSRTRKNQPQAIVKKDTQRESDGEVIMKGSKYNETRWDQQAIAVIKKDLNETPELFVLNNMLMAVMFFENYSKDIQDLAHTRHQRDEGCMVPDVVFEKVNENVRYRPLHGPKKYNSEPIISKRLFVLNNIVKIYSATEEAEEGEIGAVRVEESHRKGFIRLREIVSSYSPDVSPVPSEHSESISRTSTDSETFDYAKFADIKTPKPIDVFRSLEKQENIPKMCIAYRKNKKLQDIEDGLNLDDFTLDDLYEIVSYISSKGFMKHFQNNLFPNTIAENLGFDEDDVNQSKAIAGKIFCNLRKDEVVTPCEVIPSIFMSWPGEQTLEFMLKSQRMPEGRKRYIFPTPSMIGDIKQLGCTVVPKGYIKKIKKGDRADTDLEWEISFPQAERYLETYMSHAQMKCLIFLLIIHKTYIEPKTFELGLLKEHIRTFMLAECESNYTEWPEHRLGTKMMNVIKNLNNAISKASIPDFFISEKNHLDKIPMKYLRHAQKVFHNILESPLMSFIKSLRNLRYQRGQFYQPFDFETLNEIVRKRGMGLTNPLLISTDIIPPNLKKRDLDNDTEWGRIVEKRRRNKILKMREEEEKIKKETEAQDNERRGSVDSIDLNWNCEKKFDLHKKRKLLTFFIETFIDISQKSLQISTKNQTLFYLKQSRYLVKILEDECSAFGEEVSELITKIDHVETKCNRTTGEVASVNGVVPPKMFTNEASTSIMKNINDNGSVPVKTLLNSAAVSENIENNNVPKKNAPRKTVAFIETPVNS